MHGSQAFAYVPLMAGQVARPLKGSFNNVPVLHSNQPEVVGGSGILVNTAPGSAIAAETQEPLNNADFTFNGEFGIHIHHKYYPNDGKKLGGKRSRGLLTVAAIATNPGNTPIKINFKRGAVKNSFEAPYHPNHLMGVKPVGPRPWTTGPGDATSVEMLRGKLDRRITNQIIIPPQSRTIVFKTIIPARGIANGLLRGRSDGPFQLAVVAAEDGHMAPELIEVLDSGRLAPGRIYLNRLQEIHNRKVFSRVAGVALGDHYTAKIIHDLQKSPLHVPLTSTHKTHFGTREIQVNPLRTRMVDSALNNVGTYGVRFDVKLDLIGVGPYELVLSHPEASGKKPYTAFRGSIGISTEQGYKEVHVGLRSGESLSLTDLKLIPEKINPVTVSLVYPADATPGHLLSVVPIQQLALIRHRKQQVAQVQQQLTSDNEREIKPQYPLPKINAKPITFKETDIQQKANNLSSAYSHKSIRDIQSIPTAIIFPKSFNSSFGSR